ncbi:MAG: class I SAM-dependent methyltransferase [Chlamydiota bacterium]
MFYPKLCFILTILVSPIFSNEPLPHPYNQVSLLPELQHGWFCNQPQLEKLFSEYHITNVIELGSWLGLSTIYLAEKLPEDGTLYAVDHWEGSIEHKNDPEWKKFLPTLYDQFLSNVIHRQLTHKIVPIRMNTKLAASKLDTHADLIYVDASHEQADVYCDLNLYYPKLSDKGILCGDDWSWESVRKAVLRFAKEKNLTVTAEGNFWFFKPRDPDPG